MIRSVLTQWFCWSHDKSVSYFVSFVHLGIIKELLCITSCFLPVVQNDVTGSWAARRAVMLWRHVTSVVSRFSPLLSYGAFVPCWLSLCSHIGGWPSFISSCFVSVYRRGRRHARPPTPHAALWSPQPPESPPPALPAAGQGPEPAHSHRGDSHDPAQVPPPTLQPGEPLGRRRRVCGDALDTERPSEAEAVPAAVSGFSQRDQGPGGAQRRPIRRSVSQEEPRMRPVREPSPGGEHRRSGRHLEAEKRGSADDWWRNASEWRCYVKTWIIYTDTMLDMQYVL